jgi:hypothetical protein
MSNARLRPVSRPKGNPTMMPSRTMAALALAVILLVPGLPLPASEALPARSEPFPGALNVTGDSANFSGTLSVADNADAFKILLNRTPSNIEVARAACEKLTDGGEVRIYVYDDQGDWLSWNGTVGSGKVNVSAGAPYTGYVYMVVFLMAGGTANYAINITKENLTADPSLMDDNNSPSEAVPFMNGFNASGGLDQLYDAADFFSADLSVSAASKDILGVSLTVPPTGDFMFTVYPSGNSSNPFYSDGGDIYHPDFGTNETIYFLPQSSGKYIVRIWAEHGTGPYDLGVRIWRGWLDSNNEPDNGTEIKNDSTIPGNVSLNYDDNDYFRMYLQPDTTLNLNLTIPDFDPVVNAPLITLWLLDPGRRLINSSTSLAQSRKVGHLTQEGGWYYIKIAAGKGSAGDYILDVTTVRPPTLIQPELEVVFDEDTSAAVNLSTVFGDPQKRPLAYNFSPAEHFNISLNGTFLNISPAPDWNGHAQLTVSARNAEMKTATALIDVSVRPVNDPPVPLHGDLSFNSPEDEPFMLPMSVFALFNDVDGDALNYSVTGNDNMTVTIDENGTVRMVPALNWWGIELFQLLATDPSGQSAAINVSVNITPENDAPQTVLGPGERSFAEDNHTALDLKSAFWDPDGDVLVYTFSGGMYLTANITDGIAVVRTQYSSWPPGWDGREALNFTATDPTGASASWTVNFTVTGVNGPPLLWRNLPNQSIMEDLAVTMFNLNSYFRDPDNDMLRFTVVGPLFTMVNITPDGSVTFIPTANWSGSETMVFTAADPNGLAASANFTLTVEPVDDAPQLSLGSSEPAGGDTSTLFTFTVICRDIDSPNVTVRLVIGRKSLPMERVSGDLQGGALYRVRTTISEGRSVFYFQADDGDLRTDSASIEVDVGAAPQDNTLLYIGLAVLIIVVIALALAFSPPRKRRWEEGEEEE